MTRRPFLVVLVLIVSALVAVPPAWGAPAVTELFMVANRAGSGGWFGQTEVMRSPGATGIEIRVDDGTTERVAPVYFEPGLDNAYLRFERLPLVDLDDPFSVEVVADGGFTFPVDFPAGFTFGPDGTGGVFRGTAPPGETVEVSYGLGGAISESAVVDPDGTFSVDLSDDGFTTMEMGDDARANLEVVGPEGALFRTFIDWDLPNFYVYTSGNRSAVDIFGYGLTAGMPTTVAGHVQAKAYSTDPSLPLVDLTNGTPGDLSDDVLPVASGGFDLDIPLPPLLISEVDISTTTVSGIGPPSSTIEVGVFTDLGNDPGNNVMTAGDGSWSYDFSGIGATEHARARADIPFADLPPGITDMHDEVEVGDPPPPPGMPRLRVVIAPDGSTPADATFDVTSLPDMDGATYQATWTPAAGTGGTAEATVVRPESFPSGRLRLAGATIGGDWDPTAGGTLVIDGPAGEFTFEAPPLRAWVSGRDIVAEFAAGTDAYLNGYAGATDFDGDDRTANVDGEAVWDDALPADGTLIEGNVLTIGTDPAMTSTEMRLRSGARSVAVGPDGGSLSVPAAADMFPGVVTIAGGPVEGLSAVARSFTTEPPPGWDPAATPFGDDFLGQWDPFAVPFDLHGPEGAVRVAPGHTMTVTIPLTMTPQPDQQLSVGIWSEGIGWEMVDPDAVQVCLDTSVEGCQSSPGPHVIAQVPHASTYAAFIGNPAGETLDLQRAFGDDRIETAVALSQAAYPDGAESVIVARADDFADALASVSLADAAGAPILLNTRAGLDERVAAEIERLGASEALVMGGEAAQSTEVITGLQAVPGVADVRRRGGAERFETAAIIADDAVARWQAAGHDDAGSAVVVALGQHPIEHRAWPDALSSGQLAAAAKSPILLVRPDRVPDATTDAIGDLGAARGTVIGGTGAIPESVADGLGVPVERLGGVDRFETSLLVADAAYAAGATDRDLLVATGLNYPDGLAAGAAAAARSGLLVLVNGRAEGPGEAVLEWLGPRVDITRWVRIAGGGAAVAEEVVIRIEDVLDP